MTALSPAAAPRGLLAANLICMASMLVWAAGLPAADFLIPIVPPLQLTVMRTASAGAVLLAVWIALEGWRPLAAAPWGRGIGVGGVCIGLGAVLLVIGQAYTDAVTVAIITASMPLIGMALEVFLDGRRITGALVGGLLLSLFGGMIALARGGFTLDLGIGALAAFGSCLAFTWGSRASVTMLPGMTPLGRTALTVAGACLAVSAVTAAWSLLPGTPAVVWDAFGWRAFWSLMLFGVGSLAVSQILWLTAVERIGIGASSLHMNAVPFYVMVMAFSLGGGWSWLQTFGAAVVVLGVLVAQGLVRLPGRD
ncbi:MAG TPA: DMT family transporter [Paracoccaceae bacterium]|nr:DMT family transporter [Paracoccaceae bacterium]HMO71624.1 DMT family transporter [Paracoccaceae bacterium]